MRAFINEDEVPFDRMYASACRRLQFLSRKLIEDLEEGKRPSYSGRPTGIWPMTS